MHKPAVRISECRLRVSKNYLVSYVGLQAAGALGENRHRRLRVGLGAGIGPIKIRSRWTCHRMVRMASWGFPDKRVRNKLARVGIKAWLLCDRGAVVIELPPTRNMMIKTCGKILKCIIYSWEMSSLRKQRHSFTILELVKKPPRSPLRTCISWLIFRGE